MSLEAFGRIFEEVARAPLSCCCRNASEVVLMAPRTQSVKLSVVVERGTDRT